MTLQPSMLACVWDVPSPQVMSATYSDGDAVGSASEIVATGPMYGWPSVAVSGMRETVNGGSLLTVPPGPEARMLRPPQALPGPSLQPTTVSLIVVSGAVMTSILNTAVPSIWPGRTVTPLTTVKLQEIGSRVCRSKFFVAVVTPETPLQLSTASSTGVNAPAGLTTSRLPARNVVTAVNEQASCCPG